MTNEEYNIAVRDYADRLFRFVLKNIRHEADARDIVQQSFEKLWRKHEGVDNEKVKSYLFTIAYHTLVDWTRKQHANHLGDQGHRIPDHDQHQSFELRDTLNQALRQLPPVQKRVVLLRDYEGYSYKEIAGIAGLTEAQVKVYIFRGRKKLHQILSPKANNNHLQNG